MDKFSQRRVAQALHEPDDRTIQLFMQTLDHRAFKDQVFDQFGRIGKALASPKRLEIIDLLTQAERSVEDLADLCGTSVANASRHLQILRAARLVEVRREGLFAYYRLADEHVGRVWAALRELAEARLGELEQITDAFLEHRSHLEPVDARELVARLNDPTCWSSTCAPGGVPRRPHPRRPVGSGSGARGPPRGAAARP
jgi:DNA-binding transcriptional ArsR family regulator